MIIKGALIEKKNIIRKTKGIIKNLFYNFVTAETGKVRQERRTKSNQPVTRIIDLLIYEQRIC